MVHFSVGDKVKWLKKGNKIDVEIIEIKSNGDYGIKDFKGRKLIANEKYLLKKVSKIKKEVKNVLEFIQKDIKNKSVEQILKEASERKIDFERDGEDGKFIDKDRSYRGFVYERLWDICIKFGVVDGLTMKNNKTDEERNRQSSSSNKFNGK